MLENRAINGLLSCFTKPVINIINLQTKLQKSLTNEKNEVWTTDNFGYEK